MHRYVNHTHHTTCLSIHPANRSMKLIFAQQKKKGSCHFGMQSVLGCVGYETIPLRPPPMARGMHTRHADGGVVFVAGGENYREVEKMKTLDKLDMYIFRVVCDAKLAAVWEGGASGKLNWSIQQLKNYIETGVEDESAEYREDEN